MKTSVVMLLPILLIFVTPSDPVASEVIGNQLDSQSKEANSSIDGTVSHPKGFLDGIVSHPKGFTEAEESVVDDDDEGSHEDNSLEDDHFGFGHTTPRTHDEPEDSSEEDDSSQEDHSQEDHSQEDHSQEDHSQEDHSHEDDSEESTVTFTPTNLP